MLFSSPITSVIKARSSWRNFSSKKVDSKKIQKIEQLIHQNNIISPFGGTTKFKFIQLPSLDPVELKKLGTYGRIEGAENFLLGIIKPSKYDQENIGYVMETMILQITDLGLGTCWLGGSFNRSAFSEKAQLEEDELLPVISPIGELPNKTAFKNRFLNNLLKKRKRKPWSECFFLGGVDIPLTSEDSEDYEKVLDMVRLAPSAYNRQPWRIIKDPETNNYHFYYDNNGKNHSSDFPNYHRIDLGISVAHFDLTCQELGLEGTWSFKEPKYEVPENFVYLISWFGA